MYDIDDSGTNKFIRCIICSNYSIKTQCHNIFNTTLDRGKVLLSDFVKNVLNCSVLIVVSPEFFICNRCYSLCTELDTTLARCGELQELIQNLFKKSKENELTQSFKGSVTVKSEKLREGEVVFDSSLKDYDKDHDNEEEATREIVENIEYFLETDLVVNEVTIGPASPIETTQEKEATLEDDGKAIEEHNSAEDNKKLDTWTCRGCKMKFDSEEDLESHQNSTECKTEPKSRKIKSIFEFKNYSVRLKKKKKVFFCNSCSYETSVSSSMEKHLISHKADPMFMCDVCGRRFKYLKTFNRHQQVHDQSRPHVCKLCPYRASTDVSLKNHERIHVDQKKYNCSKCGYKTLKKMAFLIHYRTHTGERPYCCPSCPYKAKDPGTLVRHRRTHGGLKRYQCTQCDYKAVQKGALNNHMLTHTGEKPHCCPHCDYRSTVKHNLSAHIAAKHCDERPFACTVCSYKTKIKRLLTYHMRCHSDEKPFACSMCDYKVRYRAGLRYHMLKKHPPNGQPPVNINGRCVTTQYIFQGDNVVFSDDGDSDSEIDVL